MELDCLCVFAGSAVGARPAYREAAAAVGRLAAERSMTVVYGGAAKGLMGVMADAALAAGGRVVGVIPHHLDDVEPAHQGLSELRLVNTMHERKALMAELSDAFLALPGGVGTADELIEMLDWHKLGIIPGPCGALDVEGFYRAFGAFLDHAVAEGFLSAQARALLSVADTPEALIDELARRVRGG